MPIDRKQTDSAVRNPGLGKEPSALATERSKFDDDVLDDLNDEELSALLSHNNTEIPSGRGADSTSEESEEIPYEAPKAMPISTNINENGASGSLSLKRSRDSIEQQEPRKRLRSENRVSDERDASALSPPQMPRNDTTAIKRRRGSDDVNSSSKRARDANKESSDLLRLPDELIGEIGSYFVTDDADTTARALKPLRLVSHRVDDAIKGARPSYADTLYQRAIPKGPFAIVDISYSGSPGLPGDDDRSDVASALDDASRPMTAADRIRSIGPILKRHSDGRGSEPQKREWDNRRSELVEKILNISDLPQQADAIAATAPYIEAFSNGDRSRLFNGIVKAINKVDYIDDPEHVAVWHASKSFLETTWPHMQEQDHIRITGDFEADHPISLPTFNNRYVIDLIQTDRDLETPRSDLEWLASTPREASPISEEEGRISDPADGKDQDSSPPVDRSGGTVVQIPETSDDAREELLNNRGTRSDRGRSR